MSFRKWAALRPEREEPVGVEDEEALVAIGKGESWQGFEKSGGWDHGKEAMVLPGQGNVNK